MVDLARGHLAALDGLDRRAPGTSIWNLGTGAGASVHEVRAALESACGHPLAYRITDRRAGDIAASVADPTKANEELDWYAELSLSDMCRDAWRWQSDNPEGYPSD